MSIRFETEVNETSFARLYGQANMNILDGLWHIGSERAERLEFAGHQLERALKATDNPEEQLLAKQLQQTLKYYERARLNV